MLFQRIIFFIASIAIYRCRVARLLTHFRNVNDDCDVFTAKYTRPDLLFHPRRNAAPLGLCGVSLRDDFICSTE